MTASSLVSTTSTLDTIEHFGLTGRRINDITVDAFIGLQDGRQKRSSKKDSIKITKPHAVPSDHEALHASTVTCISDRDFGDFLTL